MLRVEGCVVVRKPFTREVLTFLLRVGGCKVVHILEAKLKDGRGNK